MTIREKFRAAHRAALEQWRTTTGSVWEDTLLDQMVAVAQKLYDSKQQAYLERSHLVAALARLYPSGVRRTAIPGWHEEWYGCVYIDLPTGQISFHHHDSHAHLFDGLPPYEGEWDGHGKDEVHDRLGRLEAWVNAPVHP